jgi:ATP-binding cassette subfamily F protein 3
MQSKDILKNALLQFKGTLIIVSHDRDFLQGLTEKVFEFKNKTIKTYIGDIYDFLEYKNLENLKQLETTEKLNYEDKSEKISENKINWEKRKINEKEIRKIKNKIQKCEDEISRLENEISMMDSIMANPEEFQKNIENNSFFSKYEILKQNLNQQIQLWEELHYELLENEE